MFYWIREWDDTRSMVAVTFLGHATVLAPDMVAMRYCDGVTHVVPEAYFREIVLGLASNSDLNPPSAQCWSPRISKRRRG